MMWMWVMVASAVTSWLGVAAVAPHLATAVFFGMFGPLVAVAGTWAMIERTARRNPAGVTPLMMAAFVVKMVFFAVYVAVVVLWSGADRSPFIVSFTAYFVTLYAAEALLLRRLFGRTT